MPEPAGSPQPDTSARQDTTAVAWNIVLGIDLGIMALLTGLSVAAALFFDAPEGTISKAAVWTQVAINLTAFGIIPFLWLVYTRVGGFAAALAYLHWRGEQAARGLLEGLGLTVATFALVIALTASYAAAFGEPEPSPVIEGLVGILDWPLIISLALVAGVTEEILFRGILQKWVGVWGQAILFGLSHAGYDTILNVLVPLLIGLGFGYIYRWRRNLWTVITAHFLYDLILLSAAKLFPEQVT